MSQVVPAVPASFPLPSQHKEKEKERASSPINTRKLLGLISIHWKWVMCPSVPGGEFINWHKSQPYFWNRLGLVQPLSNHMQWDRWRVISIKVTRVQVTELMLDSPKKVFTILESSLLSKCKQFHTLGFLRACHLQNEYPRRGISFSMFSKCDSFVLLL